MSAANRAKRRATFTWTMHPGPACPAYAWVNSAATPYSPRCRCSDCKPGGFTNKDLRTLVAELRGVPAQTITAGQITYDLRRLRVRGLIARIPGTHRYTISEHGLHTAMFLSAVHDRFLPTGLAQLADHTSSPPLRQASRAYHTALENLTRTTGLTP